MLLTIPPLKNGKNQEIDNALDICSDKRRMSLDNKNDKRLQGFGPRKIMVLQKKNLHHRLRDLNHKSLILFESISYAYDLNV